MKVKVAVKMIFCLLLINQYQSLVSARPHFAGLMEDMKGRQVHDQEQLPRWWSEDYSLPRRRQPVHNELKP
ncbi:hypothetical protein ACOSP7_001887 [Xanthoceras sorbifolium]|uniref:Uncharacterized protein n=1 Tax=Xanthoceras sorbifolium TaxID=99658 RepID=A0ABQ8GXF1_9ROSI|nr:hypothetical protein JRO89_XSUnG0184500 [Xanthoceras sorbifolium]